MRRTVARRNLEVNTPHFSDQATRWPKRKSRATSALEEIKGVDAISTASSFGCKKGVSQFHWIIGPMRVLERNTFETAAVGAIKASFSVVSNVSSERDGGFKAECASCLTEWGIYSNPPRQMAQMNTRDMSNREFTRYGSWFLFFAC